MDTKTKNWKKWFAWFIFAVAVISVYKLLDNFGDITTWVKNLISTLMPFIMAVILAYLFYLPCRKVEGFLKKSKGKFMQKRENLPEDSIVNKINLKSIIENLGDVNLTDFLNLEMIGEYAKGIIGIATTIFDIFVTIVVSMYLLAERSAIVGFARRFCNAIFNRNIYTHIGKYFRESNEIFFRFVSSQIIDAIIVGILTSIAMSVMGVKYGILLGFMIGLFNLIPFLGAIIAIVVFHRQVGWQL